MIIGLLALAYLIFGGGQDTFLLNPNLKKNVSTFVVDKNRRSDIDKLIKQIEKNEESFQKETKKVYEKKLVDLNMNRASTRDEFYKEYANFYEGLKGLQNAYLDSEIKIRTLILPNEWDSIMKKVLLEQPENEKIRKKLIEENQKISDKLLKSCNQHIPDSAGKRQAGIFVNEYKDKGDSVTDAFLKLNYRYMEAARAYKVTRQDFEPIRAEMIKLRKNYSNYLVVMRFKLLAITPEKEWEGLAKELNSNFRYMGAGFSE
jgi:hypothetical protein